MTDPGTVARGVCVGIDVGGTFTDAVVTDGDRIWRAKAPTTKGELGVGVLAACRLAAERSGTTIEELMPRVSRFGLGTTAVTNVLATRSGPPIGLITTRGFEDMVPLAKGRHVLDDGWVVSPPPIVDRSLIVGVAERIDREGQVLAELDPGDVVAAARRLVDEGGVEAIAVSFLWSFKNPRHEEIAVEAVRLEVPGLPVFSGAAVNPVMREFERTTFAVLNAYVGGAYTGIEALGDELAAMGLAHPLLLVHSAGGSITTAEARRVPLGLAASGPAAGVAASLALAEASGITDAVTCDMGGTSFDVSVISDGQASRRSRGDLAGIWTAMPQIDIESISAGGGSVGWVDSRGMLRVGPRSAGAVPGPACYGKGGTEPTVTDALVVLGYIDPTRFLGGDMVLDVEAAREACATIGREVGLSARETAWGIREIALDGMVKAVRTVLNARGLDPAEQAIVSFGGCGSLFTPEIARAIGATTVLAPELASVLSAFGAATADIRRDRVHSLGLTMPFDAGPLQALAEKLGAEVDQDLASDGVAEADRSVGFEVDVRFKRQISELTIAVPSGSIDAAALDQLTEDFRTEYARRYGRGSLVMGASMELVNLRAVGIGRTVRASFDVAGRPGVANGSPAPVAGSREIQLGRDDGGSQPVATVDASVLRPGHHIDGPALVDGPDTTIWIPPDATATVDERSTLVVEVHR
ncbi:MAG TPA: hydantoinase/oxoprolinase family protein [Acidimicrobiales bacterium]